MIKQFYGCTVFSIALALSTLCGCSLTDKPGTQLWFYKKSYPEGLVPDSNMHAGSFLDLRPDGQFTRDFGHFEYGTWQLKDSRLYLTNQRHKTFVYQVTSLNGKQFDFLLSATEQGMFTAYGRPEHYAGKDPFALENNAWRVPPDHRESDAELRHRLYAHCHFWEVYFKWAKKEVEGSVEVHNTPTPMKIYGNGFGLKHYDDLPAGWKACFFDEEDCRRADTLIKHTFRQNNIVWPKTDNDLDKFISGFEQLQRFLR